MKAKAAMAGGAVVAAVLVAMSVGAGDLAPPAGPVAGTMKTLEQIEPRTPISSLPFNITQSGSYYLTGNLSTTANGITVLAPDVTIDMMGFTITGSTPNDFAGVLVEFGTTGNFVLRNGMIRTFAQGVTTTDEGETGGGSSVIGVGVEEAGITGISLLSGNNLVKDCYAERATAGAPMALSTGIGVAGGVIENCRVRGFDYGLGGTLGSAIHNSVAQDCDTGAIVLSGVVRGCAFHNSGTQSLLLGGGAVAFDNYAP